MSTAQDRAITAIREAATEWVARLSAPDLTHGEKQAFAAWLRASPIHVREYLGVEALLSLVRDTVQGDATSIPELLRDGRSNVIDLVAQQDKAAGEVLTSPPQVRPGAGRAGRRLPLAVAAAALLVVAGAFVLMRTWPSTAPSSYSTATGEIRRVSLPDGSVVELNTRSRVQVAFTDHRRDVILAEGEAFFTVAKEPQRPFRVLSDSASIRAIGTKFSVYRGPTGTVVTVLEGKVATEVEDRKLELTAGERAVIETHFGKPVLPANAARVDVAQATAWRRQHLIFDNQPLSEVVAEFNRYNRRQLIVEDAELAGQGISGVFDPDDPSGLLLFLKRKGGVRMIERSDEEMLLTR